MIRYLRNQLIFNIKCIKRTYVVVAKLRCPSQHNSHASVTFNQAMVIADKSHIPFGYLFLPAPPPVESLPIPDLRTQGSRPVEQPSAELLDLIHVFQSSYGFFEHAVFTCKINSNKTLTRLTVNRTTIYDYPNFIAQ